MNKIFITGAGSGLGKEIKKICDANNIFCKTHSRSDAENSDIVGDLNEESVREKINECVEKNNINVFINNAAIYNNNKIVNLTEKQIDDLININLISTIKISKNILAFYAKKKYGMLYNINSLAGLSGCKNESIYCASKFGVKGFTDAAIQEFKDYKNIRIVNVILGAMKSKMTITRPDYNDLPDSNEVGEIILDHINKKYKSVKTDLIITRQ